MMLMMYAVVSMAEGSAVSVLCAVLLLHLCERE